MHLQSVQEMEKFAAKLDRSKPLVVGDIGSMDVMGGSYRHLFDCPPWRYVGYDVASGKNVDVILPNPYAWTNVPDSSHDVVISGQTMEHVRQPWRWILEIARILRPGGLVCIIAPNTFSCHLFPEDCWRVWPDGIRGLFEYAGLVTLLAYTNMFKVYAGPDDTVGDQVGDTIGIGVRP